MAVAVKGDTSRTDFQAFYMPQSGATQAIATLTAAGVSSTPLVKGMYAITTPVDIRAALDAVAGIPSALVGDFLITAGSTYFFGVAYTGATISVYDAVGLSSVSLTLMP